jgi:hypothetical protein
MSELIYDGVLKRLTLLDKDRKVVGFWRANNRVDSGYAKAHGLHFLPNGTHSILKQDQLNPHPHPGQSDEYGHFDSVNGKYGPYGIVRIDPHAIPGHNGLGIHSGRANFPDVDRRGPDHPTEGCIRTIDEAMQKIVLTMKYDPLLTVKVMNNSPSNRSQR